MLLETVNVGVHDLSTDLSFSAKRERKFETCLWRKIHAKHEVSGYPRKFNPRNV